MGHKIEVAKTGRASCRICKQSIAKDELRFGEEVPSAYNAGEFTYNWHHLACAAKKKPSALKEAMDSTDLEIQNKDELLATIETSVKTEKPSTLPYAEHAPTARASCVACTEKIEKGNLRIAVEAENDGGSFMRGAPKYLHPNCAVEHIGEEPEELMTKLKSNSRNLSTDDYMELEQAMAS